MFSPLLLLLLLFIPSFFCLTFMSFPASISSLPHLAFHFYHLDYYNFPVFCSAPFFSCPYPTSVVLFDLLVNILGHNLAEPAYEAEVAQLEYKLVAGEHGLVIKVKGFNHKLPVSAHTHGDCIYKHTLIHMSTCSGTADGL